MDTKVFMANCLPRNISPKKKVIQVSIDIISSAVINSNGIILSRIIPGVDGLVHISQIANKHVAKPQDELTVGQEVEAKITAIDLDKKRVSLSIRALLPEEPVVEEAPQEEVVATEETAEEVVEAPQEEAAE